jgi:hypothetical protein
LSISWGEVVLVDNLYGGKQQVKKLMVAAAMAAGLVVAAPISAGAMMEYCDWDPLVPIVTPGGHVVLVYDSVWTNSPLNVGLPISTYSVSRVYDDDGNPMTAVDMVVRVPTGLLFRFATTDLVSTGPFGSGTVLARQGGTSGSPVHLYFTLNQP